MSERCTYRYDALEGSSLESPWECPHEAIADGDRCAFHLASEEREAAGITDADVRDRFEEHLAADVPERREFVGATLPAIEFEYEDVEHDDQHPLDLRHATIEGAFVANYSRFEECLDLRHASVGAFEADNAHFEDGILCNDTTFRGPVDGFESIVTGEDADFTGVTFEESVSFDEAAFDDDVFFDGATFEAEATFLGTEFHGRSNEIGDNTSFDGATFGGAAHFDHASFGATSFADVTFRAAATFQDAAADGGMVFDGVVFEGDADFDETSFDDDATFADAVFEGETHFRGVEFEGGATVLRDDADFSGVHFAGPVRMDGGTFGLATFEEATFESDVDCSDATFRENSTFTGCRFGGTADFDEAIFEGDASFEAVAFDGRVTFRGVEFQGSSNHHRAGVTFEAATFGDDASFHDVDATSADFRETEFAGDARFTESAFAERIDVAIVSIEDDTLADFTGAHLAAGTITQPSSGWVRYDMTEATVGDVTLRSAGEGTDRDLLEYFRFCNTDFDGFDFGNHVEYLDRSNWELHSFDAGGIDHEFAVEMSPQAIEKTYQRAKTNASAESNVKAAGEFRVKRQQYARKKFLAIVRDPAEDLSTRVSNGLRASENYFLGITCGHGMRLYRVAAMFVLFPLIPALLYAFGGPAFMTEAGQLDSLGALGTGAGREMFFDILYFSYITFLTIGYGDVVATGTLGRFMAGLEVYMSVILGGLFIYALVKRSEL